MFFHKKNQFLLTFDIHETNDRLLASNSNEDQSMGVKLFLQRNTKMFSTDYLCI